MSEQPKVTHYGYRIVLVECSEEFFLSGGVERLGPEETPDILKIYNHSFPSGKGLRYVVTLREGTEHLETLLTQKDRSPWSIDRQGRNYRLTSPNDHPSLLASEDIIKIVAGGMGRYAATQYRRQFQTRIPGGDWVMQVWYEGAEDMTGTPEFMMNFWAEFCENQIR